MSPVHAHPHTSARPQVRNRRRTGRLAAALVGVLTLTGPVAAAAPPTATATPVDATGSADASAPRITLTVRVPKHVPLNWRVTVARGQVRHAGKNKRIVLQRRTDGTWRRVVRKPLAANGRYKFRIRHTGQGHRVYRVRVTTARGRVLKTSTLRRTHVHRFVRPTGNFPAPTAPPPPPDAQAQALAHGMRDVTAFAGAGPITCLEFTGNTLVQVSGPIQSTGWVNGIIYWIPLYYWWNPNTGQAEVLKAGPTFDTWVDHIGVTAGWEDAGGNPFALEQWGGTGYWLASHSYTTNGQTRPDGGGPIWHSEGWSPAPSGSGVWCTA